MSISMMNAHVFRLDIHHNLPVGCVGSITVEIVKIAGILPRKNISWHDVRCEKIDHYVSATFRNGRSLYQRGAISARFGRVPFLNHAHCLKMGSLPVVPIFPVLA
jgi:hypothetical protein